MKSSIHIQNETILFSPLNWGMGHVSRSIPLLQFLQKQNNEIIIACDENQKKIYEEYLKKVRFLDWAGYPFQFKGKGNFGMDMLRSMRSLYRFGKWEQKELKKVVEEEEISLILSDHRYFFRQEDIPSIFITHQLNLPLPWYLKWGQRFHRSFMNQFNTIWVVDDVRNSLAGNLSRVNENVKPETIFLGRLSRFDKDEQVEGKKWTTILVSGPEPYAQQFYLEQKKRFKDLPDYHCIIYKGKCETNQGETKVNWKEIDERLEESKKLISRSGYTTIMDAKALGCEVEWHPTAGQREQEYLSKL